MSVRMFLSMSEITSSGRWGRELVGCAVGEGLFKLPCDIVESTNDVLELF